jgi:hypothetical protein
MADSYETRSWNFSLDERQKEVLAKFVLDSREV